MLLSPASVPFMTRHPGTVGSGYFVTVSSIIFVIGGLTGLAFLFRAVPSELLNAVLRRDPAPDDA